MRWIWRQPLPYRKACKSGRQCLFNVTLKRCLVIVSPGTLSALYTGCAGAPGSRVVRSTDLRSAGFYRQNDGLFKDHGEGGVALPGGETRAGRNPFPECVLKPGAGGSFERFKPRRPVPSTRENKFFSGWNWLKRPLSAYVASLPCPATET